MAEASVKTLQVTVSGQQCRTLRALYPRLAKALTFPAHFGKNLDALFDALTDLGHLEVEKVVLTITHPTDFLKLEKPERRQAALDVLKDAQQTENRYDEVLFEVKTG